MFWCLYPQQSSPGPRAAWVGEEGRKQGAGEERRLENWVTWELSLQPEARSHHQPQTHKWALLSAEACCLA